MRFQRNVKLAFLSIIASSLVFITLLLPPFPQPISYHDFADKRVFFGIPNASDIFSNLPLLVIGIYGMVFLESNPLNKSSREEISLWRLFFEMVTLSAVLSIYYHLEPNHSRLALERIGLSLLFMSFLSLMLMECLGNNIGWMLAPFLLLLGMGSVLYWSEFQDLRFYGLVQIGSLILLIPLFLLFPSSKPGKGFLFLALGLYVLGKLCEISDETIFQISQKMLSGHTLKHLFSSGGTLALIAYLRTRGIKKTRSSIPKQLQKLGI